MAAAGRSRAHSARPSRPQSAEAEAREAAAAVAALPEHFRERFSIDHPNDGDRVSFCGVSHGKRAFDLGVADAKLASRRVDAMRDGGYFARNFPDERERNDGDASREKRPVTAAGCFPERRPIQHHDPAPVRPLWPSRPSTAAAACVGTRGVAGAGKRPSSAAALRRAAALCAEIENTRASEKQKRLTVDATSATSLAPLVPLSELEERTVGAYAAASPSALAPMFGDETFAAVPEEGAREEEERVSFRGGRLTVAPAAAAGSSTTADDDEEGDALARALRLCHSAAETAAGVAERLRSRDASSVPVSPRGTAGAARGGDGGETRFQTGRREFREDRSGDENDAPTSPEIGRAHV